MRAVILLEVEVPDGDTDTAREDELAAFVTRGLRPQRIRGFRGCHVAAGRHADLLVERAEQLAGVRPELIGSSS